MSRWMGCDQEAGVPRTEAGWVSHNFDGSRQPAIAGRQTCNGACGAGTEGSDAAEERVRGGGEEQTAGERVTMGKREC